MISGTRTITLAWVVLGNEVLPLADLFRDLVHELEIDQTVGRIGGSLGHYQTYPTAGLGIPRIPDDETRRAVIRGFNIVTAEYFAKLSDRLTPAAVIPMHTPEEAIAELEFVTKQLGAKVGMFGASFPPRKASIPRSPALP